MLFGRVRDTPFQWPQEANAFPEAACARFPPAAWPKPFSLSSLSTQQPPQARLAATCGHKSALGCPTPLAMLSPLSELGFPLSAGELLLSRQDPGAGSSPRRPSPGRGVVCPAAIVTSLHSSSFQPVSFLAFVMLQPP